MTRLLLQWFLCMLMCNGQLEALVSYNDQAFIAVVSLLMYNGQLEVLDSYNDQAFIVVVSLDGDAFNERDVIDDDCYGWL